MKLKINNDILSKVKNFTVIPYVMDVDNLKTEEVSNLIDEISKQYINLYPMEEITKLPKLKETRDGYKLLGKDPSHTRCAAEALLRRMVKGTPLYRLGDIIDLGNILSILTNRSVCVVDFDKLVGDITIREGRKDEEYIAINRGPLNVHHLPIYEDSLSPFGTPTSDTDRTKVDENTKTIFIMIICFSDNDLEKDEELLLTLYKKYTNAYNIKKIEVEYGKF